MAINIDEIKRHADVLQVGGSNGKDAQPKLITFGNAVNNICEYMLEIAYIFVRSGDQASVELAKSLNMYKDSYQSIKNEVYRDYTRLTDIMYNYVEKTKANMAEASIEIEELNTQLQDDVVISNINFD